MGLRAGTKMTLKKASERRLCGWDWEVESDILGALDGERGSGGPLGRCDVSLVRSPSSATSIKEGPLWEGEEVLRAQALGRRPQDRREGVKMPYGQGGPPMPSRSLWGGRWRSQQIEASARLGGAGVLQSR